MEKGEFAGNVFDEMGMYWAEIADKDQTKRQIQFIKNQLKPDGYVLDVACGSGRHMIPLAAAGYGVVGLDASPKLLRIAKQRSRMVDMVRGDLRFLPFVAAAFASAVSMDTSIGYLPSERDDLQSFRELHRALVQGGALIVDVFNRELLMRKYGHRCVLRRLRWAALPLLLKLKSKRLLFWLFAWRKYPSFFLLQKRTISREGGLLCDLWVVCPKSRDDLLVFRHRVRLYGCSRLAGMLEEAGFIAQAVYGDYEGQRFSGDSPRLILASIKQ